MSYVVLETFDKSQSEQAFLKCNLLNKKKSPASRVSYKFFIIRNKNKLKLCEEIPKKIEEDCGERSRAKFEELKRIKQEKSKENLRKIINLLSQGKTFKECGEAMNLSLKSIYDYVRRWENGIYKDFEIEYDPKICNFIRKKR